MHSDTNKLLVWKRSHELALKVYEITKELYLKMLYPY
jgi:hypothetical protein